MPLYNHIFYVQESFLKQAAILQPLKALPQISVIDQVSVVFNLKNVKLLKINTALLTRHLDINWQSQTPQRHNLDTLMTKEITTSAEVISLLKMNGKIWKERQK